MTKNAAVAALDAISPNGESWPDVMADPETFHSEADKVLLAYVPTEVREAYLRLVARSQWWACA